MRRAVPRRWSGALALLAIAVPLTVRAQMAPVPDAAGFVDAALHDTMMVLASPADPGRSERLRAVISRYFDVAQLGRNSVGAAWQFVAPAQQTAFLMTFESFLLTNYVGALARPGDLTFGHARVIDAVGPAAAAGRTLVRIDVQTTDGPARPVLIALERRDDGSYRIVDVTAEAISLGNVLAADFGSFLRRNGGHFEALIAVLHEKVAGRTPSP